MPALRLAIWHEGFGGSVCSMRRGLLLMTMPCVFILNCIVDLA